METQIPPLANNHISVDCVVLGFDGEHMKVLLVNRDGDGYNQKFHTMKLPGSLIYQDEELDGAAARVLYELTGLKNVNLVQFKAFGSKDRTRNIQDVLWLERAQKAHVERIVTVAYIALIKIDRAIDKALDAHNATWVAIDEIPELAFDHNLIIEEALSHIRHLVDVHPALLFDLLPRKFTATQLRNLYEVLQRKSIDVRNFHKKLSTLDYVVALDERQQGVAHRAARYYKFDRKIYNKTRK